MPKRERVDTGADKRSVRRDDEGRFTSDQLDIGTSAAVDQRTKAKTIAKPGHGDRGDGKT